MTRHKQNKRLLGSIFRWHRYLGLLIVLVIPLLTISGIMLNHTDDLRLGKREFSQHWLFAWYGITPVEGRFFFVGKEWLSQWGEQLYLNSTALTPRVERLIGAVRLPKVVVTSTSDALLLITPQGELLEILDSLDGVPRNIQALGVGENGRIVLSTRQGLMEGDLESGSWQPTTITPTWAEEATPPKRLLRQLRQQNPGPGISAERLLLDLHSGRLFGKWGPYLVDFAALLLLLNAFSGLLIWWRRRHQRATAKA